MADFLGYTIVGLSIAAIYSISSTGLVLTYTTTGLFNFGHGAVGMLAAFAYWQLQIDWGWPIWLALLVTLGVLAPVIGLAIEGLTRGLVDTTETTKLVVSVSLLFAMLGIADVFWDPSELRLLPQFFAGSAVDVGVTQVAYHQLATVVVAIVVMALLWVLLRGTRLGVEMRAAVDDRRLAMLTGVQPIRVQRLGWIVGSALASIAGVLVASTAGLSSTLLALLIVNAYAAAVFGRLRSLPMTLVGAIVLGLVDAYLQGYLPQNQYLSGLRLASPVIVLFLAVLVFPTRRIRPYTRSREFFGAPTLRGTLILSGAVLIAGAVLASELSDPDVITYGRIFPFAIIALSVVVLTGFANQVSLCQLSFAGIGAMALSHAGEGGNPIGLLAAAAVPALVGALVALPVVRLSGIYLALATAAFAVALDRWFFKLPPFNIGSWEFESFFAGSLPVDRLDFLGVSIGSARSQIVLSAVALAVMLCGVAWLRTSAFGRRLVAMREGDTAIATCGVNVVATRVAVFSLSAGIAGLGGAFFALHEGAARIDPFAFTNGLPLFMGVAIGGVGFIGAAILSSSFSFGFVPVASALISWYARAASLTTGGIALLMGREPSGVVSRMRERFEGRRPARRGVSVLSIGLAAVLLAYVLDVITGWAFVGLAAAVWVFSQRMLWRPSGTKGARPRVPQLETMGLTDPWSADTLAVLESELRLDEFRVPAAMARAGSSR